MTTKKILYVGIDPPQALPFVEFTHCPLISTHPLPMPQEISEQLAAVTHLILTSKSSVNYLEAKKFSALETIYAVGQATGKCAQDHFGKKALIAEVETAEGVVALLKRFPPPTGAVVCWPHAARARSVITDYAQTQPWKFHACTLYETLLVSPKSLPYLEDFDSIFFTSPSTVDAFLMAYGALPANKEFLTIGPVTEAHLQKQQASRAPKVCHS